MANYHNTEHSWGLISRLLHWGMLLLIVVQVPVGFWMVAEYEAYTKTYADDSMVMMSSMIHHSLGFLLLLLLVIRFCWRQSQPVPVLPSTLSWYQRLLARLTHSFLYMLLLIYPLSGWAALSAYDGEFPIFWLVWDVMPGIVPSVPEGSTFDYLFFAKIHRFCWRIGALLLLLHIGAALWHHFYVRDGILRRMLIGRE